MLMMQVFDVLCLFQSPESELQKPKPQIGPAPEDREAKPWNRLGSQASIGPLNPIHGGFFPAPFFGKGQC